MIQKKHSKIKTVMTTAVILILFFTASISAQQGRRLNQNNPGGYGFSVMEITGTVTDIQPAESCWRFQGNGLMATIQSGDKIHQVHLGPEAYLKQQKITIKKNDKITLKVRPSFRNRPGQHIAISIIHKDGETMLRQWGRGNGQWRQAGRGNGGWRQGGRGRNRRY